MDQVGAVAPRGRALVVLGVALAVATAAGLAWWARAPRPATEPTIAVLPLENRSAVPADAHLSAGIQDELISLLSRVGAMRVTSRNATQRFAGSATPPPRIGRALGVSYLLEGSVQRAGGALRIEVKLLDTTAGRPVWESRFERRATEVFVIESEVAQAVAEALQGRRLTPAERTAITRPPTRDPAAYDAYLRARSFPESTARDEAAIRDVIAAYVEAVRIDPQFAAAWSQLSRRQSSYYSLGYERTEARRDAALHALQSAEGLAPDAVDTQAARAYYLFVVKEDLEAAERAVRELETRFPSSPDIATGLAQITREQGRLDRSAEYSRRAVRLDPLNPYRRAQLCQDYVTSRELVLAMQTCDGARELLPDDAGILALKATIHQARGELVPARNLLRGLEPRPDDWRTLRVMSRQFVLEREPGGAVTLLARYLEAPDALGTRRGVVRRWLADAQRLAGDADAARASYQAARAELDEELARQPANPLFFGELAIARARLGEREAARAAAERCMQLALASRRTGHIGDCGLARVQVALATQATGDLPRLLEEALRQRGSLPPLTMALLRLDPDLDDQRAVVRTLTPD
jgi:TolB-like protein